MFGGIDFPIKYLSARADDRTAGGGTVDVGMTLIGIGSVSECASTAEFHIQTGTAGDIGIAGSTHVSMNGWGINVGGLQFAGTTDFKFHIALAQTIKYCTGCAGKFDVKFVGFDMALASGCS